MEDSEAAGRSSSIRLPGPVSWLVTPLARRGIRAGAFTLACSVLVAAAGLAAYGLPALAASAGPSSRLTLLTAFAGRLLGVLATLGVCALLVAAPAWITASVLEKHLRLRATPAPRRTAANRSDDRIPDGHRAHQPR
jgi:hypothetical protein